VGSAGQPVGLMFRRHDSQSIVSVTLLIHNLTQLALTH